MRLFPAAEDCSASISSLETISLIAARVFGHLIVASFQVSNYQTSLCKKGCYTVLYNACIRVLCTRYTRVIRMCITLRMDTLYTVAYNNYSITLCITSV